MKIKVIDNFLPEDIAHLYYGYFLTMPHTLTEYSTEEYEKQNTHSVAHGHFAAELDGTYFNKALCDVMMKSVSEMTHIAPEEIQVYRFHTNMQFAGIGGGSYHNDGNWCTALLMLSHVNKDSGFEYIDNGRVQNIDFKFNRLIIFNEPEMKHRGISPKTNTDGPRITIALKVELLNKSNN